MNFQLKTTWKHVRRSPYQAMAAVMIMVLTFFAGMVFVLLSLGADRLLSHLEKKPQVVVFFNDSVTAEDQVKDLEDLLNGTDKVSHLRFISKEEALQKYQEQNKSDPLLLELVSAKTLPASLEIGAKSVSDLPSLYDIVKTAPNIENISYMKDIVGSLIKVVGHVRRFGLVLICFLLVTSVFIILTVVGMKIALRKEEIEVQRLIGASKWYIRWPFLLEGAFYGMTGAIIGWAAISVIILVTTPYLAPYLNGLNLLPLPLPAFAIIWAGAVVAGIIDRKSVV